MRKKGVGLIVPLPLCIYLLQCEYLFNLFLKKKKSIVYQIFQLNLNIIIVLYNMHQSNEFNQKLQKNFTDS